MPAALLLALALAAPARAQHTTVVEVGTMTLSGYEEFSLLGWGQGCTAAVSYLRYPPTGKGLSGIPDSYRVGTLTLEPDSSEVRARWSYGNGKASFSRKTLEEVEAKLRRDGRYDRPGTVERTRFAPVADQPGLAPLLTSTQAFQTDPPLMGIPARFRFKDVYYSPLVSCALFVFQDPDSAQDGLRWRLARNLDPDVRRKRARAHVSNALLFYRNDADLTSAKEELAVAATMEPRYAPARYYYAMLLSLHGLYDGALANLKAAVQLDGAFAEKARQAPEFEPLLQDERFQAILAAAPPVPRGEGPAPKVYDLEPRKGPPARRHY